MKPIEIVAKAIRKEFIDKIVDKANPHWGEQKPDYLLNACKEAGYPEPDKAADFFANAAARAALLALAESELPEDAKMKDEMNPAALSALAKGDMDNFLVASTPGGIEAQEKAGQTALVNSTLMPKEMRPSREAFEKLGFIFGDEVDGIFLSATLPNGWTRSATDHSMHSDILDDQGRKRVDIFYKAAFYDRRANAYLVPRFRIEHAYPEGALNANTMIPVIVTDGGTEILRVGEATPSDWSTRNRLEEEAKAWLAENKPGWDDRVGSWDI